MNVITQATRDVAQRGAEAIARARALTPILSAAAPRIDAANQLPDDVLAAMYDANIFRLMVPRAFGGDELRPVDYVQCVEAVAMGNASAAWCMNQGSGCSMSAAYLDPAVASKILGVRDGVIAWGQLRGSKAVVVDGGFRVSGKWAFCSGGRHATWIGGHCHVVERDGSLRKDSDGRLIERTMLLPKSVVGMEDDWQVFGLRGTGSNTFFADDVFVADDHSLQRDVEAERRQFGTLYRFTTNNMYAAGFSCVAMGIARAMLDDFVALAREKSPAMAGIPLRDNNRVQFEVAHADVSLQAARNHLLQVLDETWDVVREAHPMPMENRVRIRTASTYGIHVARKVAETVWNESGATAIFDSNPFERRYRDIHTVTQQAQGRSSHFENVGNWMLGGNVNLRFI
jgi:alkylation response protein AidB-like acyl-CoA dehydrogenase